MPNIIDIGKSAWLYEYPSHSHEHWECALYLKGVGTVTSGGDDIPIRPGLFICSPPGVDHHEQAAGGYANFTISFRSCPLPAGRALVYREPSHQPFLKILELILTEFHLKRKGWERLCDQYLETIFRYLDSGQQETIRHASVEKLEHLLLENISTPGFQVKDALKGFDISPFYFSRLFKEQTGEAPLQYLLRRRIDAACHFLRTTGHGVQDVALQVGFDDPYYFSRAFKKLKGCSPREFRRMSR